tara:strand:- start:1045 stop:1224 length:180 start_codon:yes stop_codon:yes gene_type:complete
MCKKPTDEMLKKPSMYCYEPDVVRRYTLVLSPSQVYIKDRPAVKFTSLKAALKAAIKPC